jgi:hypothetical protein
MPKISCTGKGVRRGTTETIRNLQLQADIIAVPNDRRVMIATVWKLDSCLKFGIEFFEASHQP